ncbi:MAG TPA: ATP synthase F1 subunit gamma [Candidatus Saccharimonadales bacterium]
MASTIVLKGRIKSIKNTRQITKAMQLVSASKMRRAQDYAFRSRAYRDMALSLLQRLNATRDVQNQPLFTVRPVNSRLYIVITSNSGLAGAYNANVLKLLAQGLRADKESGTKSKVVVIGSKGAQFVRRLREVELVAVYSSFGDRPTANDVRPILNTLIQQYADADVDEVRLLYTLFKSNIVQEVQTMQLLPASVIDDDKDGAPDTPLLSTFEPNVETVIDQVTTRLIEAQIWQALLESLASEHSMRMISMKNATDNANDLIDDYTLEYNTARQAGITQELAEITGGAEALNG